VRLVENVGQRLSSRTAFPSFVANRLLVNRHESHTSAAMHSSVQTAGVSLLHASVVHSQERFPRTNNDFQ
jgi:hypothetical protein